MTEIKDEDYLRVLGFKRVDLDDFSGFWMEKKIADNPYLTNCEVLIDTINKEQLIFLNAKDWESRDDECCICQLPYTRDNLAYLLKWLKP